MSNGCTLWIQELDWDNPPEMFKDCAPRDRSKIITGWQARFWGGNNARLDANTSQYESSNDWVEIPKGFNVLQWDKGVASNAQAITEDKMPDRGGGRFVSARYEVSGFDCDLYARLRNNSNKLDEIAIAAYNCATWSGEAAYVNYDYNKIGGANVNQQLVEYYTDNSYESAIATYAWKLGYRARSAKQELRIIVKYAGKSWDLPKDNDGDWVPYFFMVFLNSTPELETKLKNDNTFKVFSFSSYG